MPTTPYLPQPPTQMGTNLSQTDYNWQLIVQGLAPLFEVDTSKGSYAESVPAAGVNPANPATGQSAQGKEIIYVKTSADSNTYTLNGVQGGPFTLTRFLDIIRIKSDGTKWWPSMQAGGGGGGGFTTAGQGFFLGAQSFAPVVESSGGSGAPTNVANQIVAVELLLPVPFSISKLSAYVVTGGGAGYMDAALYSADGTSKLIDAGTNAFDIHTASQTLRSVSISTVNLPAGTYQFTVGATDTAGSVIVHENFSWFTDLFNANVTRIGIAANSIVAGAMPATLGALTPLTHSDSVGVPAVLFQV